MWLSGSANCDFKGLLGWGTIQLKYNSTKSELSTEKVFPAKMKRS